MMKNYNQKLKSKKFSFDNFLDDNLKAYIAGFLDGDGNIIFQIVKNNTYKQGFQLRISMAFYQKTTRHWFLLWLDKTLKKSGSLSKGKDHISVQTILAEDKIKDLLEALLPQLKIKKNQAKTAILIFERKSRIQSRSDFIEVCKLIDKATIENDSKKRKITAQVVEESFNKPVETLLRFFILLKILAGQF